MKLQSRMCTGNGCLLQHVNFQAIGSDQPCVCIQLFQLRFSQLSGSPRAKRKSRILACVAALRGGGGEGLGRRGRKESLHETHCFPVPAHFQNYSKLANHRDCLRFQIILVRINYSMLSAANLILSL